MRLEDKVAQYLEFCRYRKELDEKPSKHIGLIYGNISHILLRMFRLKSKLKSISHICTGNISRKQ